MTTAEAMEIRDRAKRLGLENCCEECSADIAILDQLSLRGRGGFKVIPPSLPQAVEASQAKEPVVGTAMEDAARRLRRSIGRGSAA